MRARKAEIKGPEQEVEKRALNHLDLSEDL
jgi:hypothetical protein